MSLSAVGGVSYLKIKHNRSLVFLDFHSRRGCNRWVKLFRFLTTVLLTCKGDHFRSLEFTFRNRNSLYRWAPLWMQRQRKNIRFTFCARDEAIVQPNQAHDATTTDFHSWDGERRCFVWLYAARRNQRLYKRKYLSAAGEFYTKAYAAHWEDIFERFYDVAQMSAAGREKQTNDNS